MPIQASGPYRDRSAGIDVVGSIVKRASYCQLMPEGGEGTKLRGGSISTARTLGTGRLAKAPIAYRYPVSSGFMPRRSPPTSSVDTLGRRGRRVTGPRRRVADLLDRRGGTFTAADLLDDADQ